MLLPCSFHDDPLNVLLIDLLLVAVASAAEALEAQRGLARAERQPGSGDADARSCLRGSQVQHQQLPFHHRKDQGPTSQPRFQSCQLEHFIQSTPALNPINLNQT